MFYVKERINKKNCIFKIDTGSDVTLIRKGLLEISSLNSKFLVTDRLILGILSVKKFR